MMQLDSDAPVSLPPVSVPAALGHVIHEPMPCAWCLREQGVAPQEGDSHGICRMHMQRMLAEHRKLRAQRSHPCA